MATAEPKQIGVGNPNYPWVRITGSNGGHPSFLGDVMAERALRGTRLGAISYENDDAVDFAPRQVIAFQCVNDHTFSVPFAEEAELPTTWECRQCGAMAHRVDGAQPLVRAVKPARTHWDMLLERRTVDDLEELLAERLALLRSPKPTRKSA